MADIDSLIERALEFDRHAISQLVSLFEDRRPDADARRDVAMKRLTDRRRLAAPIVGITGTPGSGKSSLLARLTDSMLRDDDRLTVAVIAVDPSSPTSGGALLGDRTRMRPSRGDDRLYFRSQASAAALGGLAPTTFDVCRALRAVVDLVLVETVGIGQSEADIGRLADRSYLVVGPLGGDEVQYLKAGVIEIPDAFIVSKCDEPAAATAYHQLRGSLWLARPFDADDVPIFRTSARSGEGIDELAADVRSQLGGSARSDAELAEYAFERWVSIEWGRSGERHLARVGGAATFLATTDGTISARREFSRAITTHT